MPSMNTLTHIVYCLCNNLEHGNPNLTEPKQYEAQQSELLKEECIIKENIFKTAVAIVSGEEHKQYLAFIARTLSTFSKMLESTLADEKVDKDASIVSLLEEASAVIERISTFFYKLFPDALAMDLDDDHRFKLGISVTQMAAFANALKYANGMTEVDDEKVIVDFITRHFRSKYTSNISPKSFLNHFRNPEPAAIKKIIAILKEMIAYLESL